MTVLRYWYETWIAIAWSARTQHITICDSCNYYRITIRPLWKLKLQRMRDNALCIICGGCLVSNVCLLRFRRAIQPHTAPHPYTYSDYNNHTAGRGQPVAGHMDPQECASRQSGPRVQRRMRIHNRG
jgi:hypothetical protein